ncbi:MAG: hypothetical protein KatS3mg131_1252 [Candidatus Tectimicrobiota bacterium]|nr:MAG: hypothetical protein KatS3mg131_1252 [Candidatus Tectomicrobia bacterium]
MTFIDSSGLGTLVTCFSAVRKHGGSMKLAHVPKQVADLLALTKLEEFFETYASEEAALASQTPQAGGVRR